MMLVLALLAAEPATVATSAGDPNETICRSVGTIGSRLARQRRCLTRAEWEADRLNNRRSAEDAQTGQTQPTLLTPGERARVSGRYLPAAAGGPTGPR